MITLETALVDEAACQPRCTTALESPPSISAESLVVAAPGTATGASGARPTDRWQCHRGQHAHLEGSTHDPAITVLFVSHGHVPTEQLQASSPRIAGCAAPQPVTASVL